MFGITGLQEFVILMILIVVLNSTGLWSMIIRGLRELRGEEVPPEPAPAPSGDLDMCYRVLGLSASATWDEVEKAYRRKAKIHHPDHGGDEDTMRVLNEAYARIKKARSVPRR